MVDGDTLCFQWWWWWGFGGFGGFGVLMDLLLIHLSTSPRLTLEDEGG
jgi:hypothetical protein